MKRVVPWLLTLTVCTPNVLSGVETVNALTRDKKEQTKISDVKFSKDAIHSQEKMDLSFKIEKPKASPLERTYSIPKDIEHSLIPTKSKYVIKQKKKEVGEIRFKKDKMTVQWKQDTAQQKIETDCTLEVKAHYYNDEEEINKVKIGKEVTKILPKVEPLENENLLIQDIHYQPLEKKKENQVVLDLKWPVTTELKKGNQYVFKLPKWMEAKKRLISFKDDDKEKWFEAKIEKERVTLKILKGKVYDPTVYRLPIVFRVNANQNEKVVQWMKRAIPLQKKSVAMDEIDTAAVDTTKETKEEHKQSSTPESSASSTHEKTRSVSLTSDSADDATSTTTTNIQDAIILSHQEVKEGATEQEEIKIRTVEELLQKSQRIRRAAQERSSGLEYSISANAAIVPDKKKFHFTVNLEERYAGQIKAGMEDVFTLTDLGSDVAYLEAEPQSFALTSDDGDRIGTVTIDEHLVRVRYEHHRNTYRPIHAEFRVPVTARNFTTEDHKLYMEGGNTKLRIFVQGLPENQVQARPLQDLSNSGVIKDIYIGKTEFMNGEKFRIDVQFQEDRIGQIRNGDTLTIRFPKQGYAYLEGYHVNKEPIYNQKHIQIGYLDVDSDQAKVTFTNTDLKYHIQGSFYFECQARNTNPNPNGSTEYLETNFGIPTGKYYRLSITKPEEPTDTTSPTFYYKVGMMTPDNPGRVRWGLIGNMNQDWIRGEMRIRDYVQSGQKIDWSSMTVSLLQGDRLYPTLRYDLPMEEFERLGLGYVKKLSETSFEVVLNENPYSSYENYWNGRYVPAFHWNYMSGITFTIGYETIVTNNKQKYFENKSEIFADYRTPEGDKSNHWEKDEYNDARVENIFYGGGAVNDDINIKLHKVDADKHNIKLSDAHFVLTNRENNQKFEGITDKNGEINFENIPSGKYSLQEIKAPKGYKLNSKIYYLTISEEGIHFNNDYPNIISVNSNEFTVVNKKKAYTGPLLPNTGGDGYKTWFILVACTLILGTMILYIYNKKGTHTQ